MRELFLGTAAPPGADLLLLLEIGMGVGLVFGAWACSEPALSATCLVPIHHRASESCGGRSDSLVSGSCNSKDSSKAREDLLRTVDSALGARHSLRTHRAVHLAVGGDEPSARKSANHQIHSVDAKRPSALVGRTLVGIRDVRTLVRSAWQMN